MVEHKEILGFHHNHWQRTDWDGQDINALCDHRSVAGMNQLRRVSDLAS
jgi:hypothetical protein